MMLAHAPFCTSARRGGQGHPTPAYPHPAVDRLDIKGQQPSPRGDASNYSTGKVVCFPQPPCLLAMRAGQITCL